MNVQKFRLDILKILLLTVSVCIAVWGWKPACVLAEEISGRQNAVDIIFVVDASGSMRSNDSNGIALEMVKAFIDTSQIENTRIGFVAYNDQVISATAPIEIANAPEREALKALISNIKYSGNTDIGLGLTCAYGLIQKAEDRDAILVLVSDGVSDLAGSVTGRTLEQSNQELEQIVQQCRMEEIPIYTIAFGKYSGSTEVLQEIADNTKAKTYAAQNPQLLIEVLYDILGNNLIYKMQQFAVGRYASGNQEINCTMNEEYLSEIDVLLISPQGLGATAIRYGEEEIQSDVMSYYAVGKVVKETLSRNEQTLTVSTETTDGQQVEIYVIGYRGLEPVLNIEPEAAKNSEIGYQIYFKDINGNIIKDEVFYQDFELQLHCTEEGGEITAENRTAEITDGILQGTIRINQSGKYALQAEISDTLGSYRFDTELAIYNTAPSGALPTKEYSVFSKEERYLLDEWFHDSEGDELQYFLQVKAGADIQAELNGSELIIKPGSAGRKTIILSVSDGEAVFDYEYEVAVSPIWKTHWWLFVMIVLGFLVLLRKRVPVPQAKPEMIADIKSNCHFSGRLDLYFTLIPEAAGEIPPLVFSMHKIHGSKIPLGQLLQEYPEEVAKLGLDRVYLIADEGRKMTLYHDSDATIMVGNSIVCKQTRYSISFGDVIYITSADGTYELELHYISMIQ